MRITLVISCLKCGGAERVATTMANYWAEREWEVTLLTLAQQDTPPFFSLRRSVNHIDVGLNNPTPDPKCLNDLWDLHQELNSAERAVFLRYLRDTAALREAILRSEPEAVISFVDITNLRVLLATRGTGLRVIVSEQSDPSRVSLGFEGWAALRRRLYPTAHRVVTLTEEGLRFFAEKVQRIGSAIPNPVVVPDRNGADPSCDRVKEGRIAIALGRLSHEKGFDLLLRAFARVASNHPLWRLEIWGDGPLRNELGFLAERLKLSGRAFLRGVTRNPVEALRKSDLFVLPSRLEGFPNALCEAMACGLPVVAFDCGAGVREIVRDGFDGLLAPAEDVPSLTAALDRLMASESERKILAWHAPEILDRFNLESVMNRWETLL